MSEGTANTGECQVFEAKLTSLMADFTRRHSMVPVGENRYFGVDPKGVRAILVGIGWPVR